MTSNSSSDVLKSQDIHRAMKALKEQSEQPTDYIWIENEFYYMSRVCEAMWGKRYSLEEVEAAKKRENGLLDERYGYKLYITRMLKSSTPL